MTGRPGVQPPGRPARLIIMYTRRRVLHFLAVFIAGALLAGCGASANPPAASSSTARAAAQSGIRGVTMVDGGCPMSRDATPCADRAIAARITITPTGSASAPAHLVSDGQGRFEIVLPPGAYRLQAGSLTGAPVPSAAPQTVEVHAGRYTTVTVQLDSGVR